MKYKKKLIIDQEKDLILNHQIMAHLKTMGRSLKFG